MTPIGVPWFRHDRNCWYVWHDGKQVRLHPNKVEAYRLYNEMLQQPTSKLTVGVLIEKYLVDVADRIKPITYKTYCKVTNILPKNENAAEFDFKSWLNKNKTWSRSYKSTIAMMVKQLYKFAVREGLLEVNPYVEWTVPCVTSRGMSAVVTKEEHEALVAVVHHQYKDALNFVWFTGCRPSEMCNVTASDYHDGVMVLQEHKTEGKTSKPRLIVLCSEAKEIVERRLKEYPTDTLFRNSHGRKLNSHALQVYLYVKCEKLGIKVIAYGYRHAYGTTALSQGVPDALVAQLLGHSGTQTLHKHYSHLTSRIQALKDAAAKVRPTETPDKE